MKRFFSLRFLALFLLSLMISPGFSQKAADILEKMIEAQGGRKVLEGIKDTTLSGSAEAMGVNMTITMYTKEPNKMRRDAEGPGISMTEAFDGEIAWKTDIGSQKPSEETGKDAADAKSDAQGYASILHPEKYGIKYVLKGKEKIKGKDYFVLEKATPGGTTTTQYVDTKTYLIYKTVSSSVNAKGVAENEEYFMSDYRNVDSVMIAHSLSIPLEGGESLKVTFTKVSFNTGLEDSLFKMKKRRPQAGPLGDNAGRRMRPSIARILQDGF
jgi:outer membrane lipoprotein-sorting protein